LEDVAIDRPDIIVDSGGEPSPVGPVVKICGLTRLEDAQLAWDLGAWALGLVFAPSPRRLTPAAARRLLDGLAGASGAGLAAKPGMGESGETFGAHRDLRPDPLFVGVFGDASAEEIGEVAGLVGLDAVQLHGTGVPEAKGLRAALSSLGRAVIVIKAVPVDPGRMDVAHLREAVARARDKADLVLLDTRTDRSFGGTGATFPWTLAAEVADGFPFLVAGGIGPANVRTALDQSGAWGVDVSSGVERSPGIKDAERVRRLMRAVAAKRRGLEQAGTRGTPPDGPQPRLETGRMERREGMER
jgi:phosphoribosylanthranilate isomerase